MKKIILLLFIIPKILLAQLTTIDPDTVCYGTGGSLYEVQPTVGLTYNWTVVSPGLITNGQGTNQINVDWSNANPGLIPNAVQVQASNNIGCLSPIVTLDVFIYNELLILTPLNDICENAPCVPLNATPVNGQWSGVGVINDEFCPSSSGNFVLTYTYNNAGCVFVNSISINVLPTPFLLPIEHN